MTAISIYKTRKSKRLSQLKKDAETAETAHELHNRIHTYLEKCKKNKAILPTTKSIISKILHQKIKLLKIKLSVQIR